MATATARSSDDRTELWPLLPILMPAAWETGGPELRAPLLRRPSRTAGPHLAVARVLERRGIVSDVRFVYDRDHDRTGVAAEQVMASAFQNLRARGGRWAPMRDRVVIADDDVFAAERVCHPQFLMRGAALLGAREGLVVVAPRRGVLLATAFEAFLGDAVHARGFCWLAGALYRDAGERQISPLPIQIGADGRIQAAIETLS